MLGNRRRKFAAVLYLCLAGLLTVCCASVQAGPAQGQTQSVQRIQDVTIRANEFRGTLKRGEMVLQALGNPKFSTPDSQMTANKMSFVVEGAKGVTQGRAEGDVSLRARLKSAGPQKPETVVTGSADLAVLDRQAGTTLLMGGVKIKAESTDGRVLTASAKKATIYHGRRQAVFEGDVVFTIVAPGSFEGPATLVGETFVYNLSDGTWSLKGGPEGQTTMRLKAKSKGQ
ncbi:MAG: hypothetical protein ACUVTZ_06900 [Armatimonadota bacterium]